MTRCVLPVTGLLSLAVSLALTPGEGRGCASATHEGERVDVADETALIVWDATTKTQHFIRQATFAGSTSDFGFLVPTPSPPKVELASAVVFDFLANLTRPRIEHRNRWGFEFDLGWMGYMGALRSGSGDEEGSSFEVLEQKRVGDLDVAVLAFRGEPGPKPEDSAQELIEWLNRNQYGVRPALTEWLVPYIQQKWTITAFKIARDTGSAQAHIRGSTVRMSFKTERPFFPYREPADQRDVQATNVKRLLRVYTLADERLSGKLGDGSTAWPAKTVWASDILEWEREALLELGHVPGERAKGLRDFRVLTEFEDRSTPRSGTDEVYFEPSKDFKSIERPPHIIEEIRNPIWLDVLNLLLSWASVLGGLYVVGRVIRRVAGRRLLYFAAGFCLVVATFFVASGGGWMSGGVCVLAGFVILLFTRMQPRALDH